MISINNTKKKRTQIARLFNILLSRAPESNDCIDKLVTERIDLVDIVEGIVSSEEFINLNSTKYRKITNQDLLIELTNACYLKLLGRTPENQNVLRQKIENFSNSYDLLAEFTESSEYKIRINSRTFSDLLKDSFCSEPQIIEYEPDKEILDRMFSRIQRQWQKLGDEEPFYSVLTYDKFKSKNMSGESEKEFYITASDTDKMIQSFFKRNKIEKIPFTCFELGCGVGRLTFELSLIFKKVIASDISPGNINLAKSTAASKGLENIEFIHISSLSDFDNVTNFDFLFSLIVLQHNPPPIQKIIIDQLLKKINVGGGCLIQIPTELPEYSFDSKKYINSTEQIMEMHALPMHVIFNLFKENNLEIKEVRHDPFAECYGSYTFFAYNKGGARM